MPLVLDVEIIGYLAAVLTTAAHLPQTILTIRTSKTDSLSLGMYSMLVSGIFFWFVYGLMLGDGILITANALALVLAAPVLVIKALNEYKDSRKKKLKLNRR